MKKLNINKSFITSILVIILMAVLVYSVLTVFSTENSSTAEAESVGLNGVVEDGYVSSFKSNAGATAIATQQQLEDWFSASATEENPKYGYLTTNIPVSASTVATAIKYHFLDGCGFTITITSASGSISTSSGKGNEDTIIAEDATYSSSAWTQGTNYLNSNDDGTYGDAASIIASYGDNATPFGTESSGRRGFYTAGYLGAIFAYSSMINTNVVFNGTFSLKKTDSNRGISIGMMFGYIYNSRLDNCSLTVNGKMGVYHGTSKSGNYEGTATACLGGYAGVVDKYSYITNSKITMAEGSFISGFAQGNRSGLIDYNHPRVFVGGITGSLLSSTIKNITATGSGNLRAWAGGSTNDSGNNRMGCSGIIAGINVSSGVATSAYTPAHTGNNETNTSKATAGTINGVICSWTGIAMFLMGSSQYVRGTSNGDTFYHGTAINGTKDRNVCEHFYGGCICAAAADGSVSGVFYTFEQSTLYDIAYDTYRYLRSANSTGGDGYGTATNTNSVGVQPVVIGNSLPSGNYFVLQMQQTDGTYSQTTGTYSRASYSGTDNTAVTIGSNTYYINRTFTAKGSISNVQTDVFGLEWSNTSDGASVVAKVDATKISAYNSQSGLFVWSLEAYNEGSLAANKECYRYANSMSDALTNYRQYSFIDSFMARSTTEANYTIKASIGYAGTYLLNGDTTSAASEYTESLGSKTFNATSGLTTPKVKLYTLDMSQSTPSLTQMKVQGSHTGVNVGSQKTEYTNAEIWKVYKQGSAYMYGFDDILNAGTYTLRVNKGITDTTDDNYKYDFIDTTNKIVAYKVDNKYYDVDYPTSLWQPTYTYTINQKEINSEWQAIHNDVDNQNYSAPTDFTYTGKAYNFAYVPTTSSGYLGSDPLFGIPMTYELITYSKISSANLERGNSYYLMDDDDNYYLFGEYVIDGDNKYFKVAIDTSKTFYKATGDELNPYVVVLPSNFEVGTTYYTLEGEEYVAYGTFLETGYVSKPVASSVYYRRVYKTALDVKNAGSYRITVEDCNDANYKISDSLQREWEITITPRTIEVYFRDMDNIIYNAREQKVTWSAGNQNKEQLKDEYENIIGTAPIATANIVIFNLFDPAAVNVTYDDNGKEYTTSGMYYVTISLASGAVAGNYYLPSLEAHFESEDHEQIFDDSEHEGVAQLELNDKGKIIGTTRRVTIKQASVSLLRQYTVANIESAAFIDREYGTTYNYYASITDPVYVLKNISFKGLSETGYFEEESYKGFNSLPCVIKGVTDYDNAQYFDLIYCDPEYYPAELKDGVYVVDTEAEALSVISAKGLYVAKLTFDTEAYINYAQRNFYVVYNVLGVNADITIDMSSLSPEFEYDGEDHTAEYANPEDPTADKIASVSNLVKVDILNGADVNFKYYIKDSSYEGDDALIIDDYTYAPIANVKNAGKYVMVIAHDSIPEASYILSLKNKNGEAYTGPLTADGDPYKKFEITPILINVNVSPAEKNYSVIYNKDISYVVDMSNLSAEQKLVYDNDKDNIIFKFRSEGFAANAEVGTYDVIAACEGEAAQNYIFAVQQYGTFTVNKLLLTYTIADLEKEYGETFDFGYRSISINKDQFDYYRADLDLLTREDVTTYPGTNSYIENNSTYYLADNGTQQISLTETLFGYYRNKTQLYIRSNTFFYIGTDEYVPQAIYNLANDGSVPVEIDSAELFGYYAGETALYTREQAGYIYTEAQEYVEGTTYYSDELGTPIAIANAEEFATAGTVYTRTEKYVYTPAEGYAPDTQYYVEVSENVYEEATKDSADIYGYYTIEKDIYIKTPGYAYTLVEDTDEFDILAHYYLDDKGDNEVVFTDEDLFDYYRFATPIYYKLVTPTYHDATGYTQGVVYYVETDPNVYTAVTIANAKEYGYYDGETIIFTKGTTTYPVATSYDNGTKYYLHEPVSYTKTSGNILEGDSIDSLTFSVERVIDETTYYGTEQSAPTGMYSIYATATGTRSSNYAIEVVGRFTVIRKNLTIADVVAASNLVYDSEEKTPTVTFNGVYESDDVQAVITYNGSEDVEAINVGNYTAKVTGITGAQKDNYNFIASDKESDAEFAITAREVSVNVKDFEMGYGDTKLVPEENDTGYTLASALDFMPADIADKSLVLTFKTLNPATMDSTPGPAIVDCVTLELSGDAASNYNLTVLSYGDLQILTKELTTIELKESSMDYTGENLLEEIELDTNGDGVEIKEYYALDDEYDEDDKYIYDTHTYKPTQDITNAGKYLVKVSLKEGATYYTGDDQYLEFTVEKATWLMEDFQDSNDITVTYNSIKFGGKFAGYTIMVNLEREYPEDYVVTDTLTGLQAMKQYTFYVVIGESDNYKQSAVMEVKATTTYDPNKINDDLDTLGTTFGYSKVNDYKTILANYNKVADADKDAVDSTKFSAATARYNKLMNAGAKAVTITKQIAGKTVNKSYQVAAAASVSGAGFVIAGLSCFFVNKKKRQNNVKEEK